MVIFLGWMNTLWLRHNWCFTRHHLTDDDFGVEPLSVRTMASAHRVPFSSLLVFEWDCPHCLVNVLLTFEMIPKEMRLSASKCLLLTIYTLFYLDQKCQMCKIRKSSDQSRKINLYLKISLFPDWYKNRKVAKTVKIKICAFVYRIRFRYNDVTTTSRVDIFLLGTLCNQINQN